jgi:hypothetical protein
MAAICVPDALSKAAKNIAKLIGNRFLPSRVFGDSPKPKASVLMDAVIAEWLREIKSYCSGLRGAPKAESLGERSPRKLSGSRPKKSNDSSSRRPRSLKRGRNEPVKKKSGAKPLKPPRAKQTSRNLIMPNLPHQHPWRQ